MNSPTCLRAEQLEHALGIGTRRPRLSWWLPADSGVQLAHRIRTGEGWDSGRVEGADSVHVPYGGPPPGSGERITWQVKVWTDAGESDWSEWAWFETGLLDPSDWQALWIEPVETEVPPAGHRPAHVLRTPFSTTSPVRRARLYATAQGLYEAFLNGERIGDAELTPGFTQYDVRLQVQTYDVTALAREGDNVLGALLSDGWFRGQIGITRAHDQWGKRVSFLAQLHLEHEDGTTTVVCTGKHWRSATAHIVETDLITGQFSDLRRTRTGWDVPGYDGQEWGPVDVADHGYAGLVTSPAPPVRRVEELAPVSVTRPRPDRQVFDLGQNINGWVRLRDLGPKDTRLTLTHGESLDHDGDVTTDHLRVDLSFLPEPLPAGQVDHVVSAGRPGETFEPRHTTHGFRYVRIEGHPGELTTDDLRGVVVHTDLRRTGWFDCGDERINRLHEAAVWSMRGNVCDIPTDCPTRERAGWTGDWQVFAPTAAFLYDVAGFSAKWLRDVAADQWPDGTVSNISPACRTEGPNGPVAHLNGSAGWGDAAIIVPWQMYRAYGDRAVLEELWPTMTAWLGRTERVAREARHPDRVLRSAEPAPHERYLWDTGFHWGEWLVPGEHIGDDLPQYAQRDKADIATAYYAHSTRLAARIARVIGRDEEAAAYEELSERIREAWRTEFITPDGSLRPDTQANHVRALAFDLVPKELRARTAERLAELVRDAGTHLGTGFLATPDLLPVLADTGHLDVAYELLLQDSAPSWLHMIDRGATTIWESWEGVADDGTPRDSLNHYSKGAVVSFLHRYTAGIEPDADFPGYQRFTVAPRPGGGLAWARAEHHCPYGQIESAWEVDGDRFRLDVTVPPGTTAEVVLPDGTRRTAIPGTHTYHCAAPAALTTTGASR
ncbi:family 78 glycoside hydrolase catalytic domain [Streptomyces griseorubiginosus]|uniref:family 78 glycoside hydrolase catalytic domain n=1 Tax=Streptomyces griseorubiginosus TaxID=67304 RepID=UPI002E7FDA93|nr:family 78 glycoside hydrolase catalytic domain [Streptomyces griseorubiginosus]WUB42671.1 glycoside hydrolase family 78 protein [Streptomyces griseorubiginosus]WUB51190.1 glycoside hydrolase family 78 protein [Streptomyces griseorubiginosus]